MLKFSDFKRIISMTDDPAQTCHVTAYCPFRYAIHDGSKVIMTQGGIVDPVGGWKPDGYDTRHVDQLYVSKENTDKTWTLPTEMVTRHNVRWMKDSAYMNANPAAFISAWTGGNVIQIGDEFIGIFCGCVNDPNCCTEWGTKSNAYGSCISPFPHFESFIMASRNGIDGWHIVEDLFSKKSGNVIEDARFLGMTPTPDDYNLPPKGPTGFKGVDKCSIGVLHTDNYWYGTADFWSSWGPKTLIWRAILRSTAIDFPAVWDGRGWLDCENGILPTKFNNDTTKAESDRIWVGNAFDCPAGTLTTAPISSPRKYMIALLMSPEAGRPYTQVGVSFTDDFVNWTPKQALTENMEFQVGDPQVYAESDGSITILFGATECTGEAYRGRGIYKGNTKI